MNKAAALPATIVEFKEAVIAGQSMAFLRWSASLFHVPFIRLGTGKELPAIATTPDAQSFIISPNLNDLMSEITRSGLLKEGELEIKTLTLAEIARNAKHRNCHILWIQDAESIQFQGDLLDILGLTATVRGQEDKEVTYQAEVFNFNNSASTSALPPGSVQRWWTRRYQQEPADGGNETFEMWYVYDDRFDWSDPYLPVLPKNSLALSSLTESARAFFEQLTTPMWDELDVLPGAADSLSKLRHSSLVPTEFLEDFWRLRRYISDRIVPQSKDIKLVVESNDETEKPEDKTEYWVVRFEYPSDYRQKVVPSFNWVTPAALRNTGGLPDNIGTYPITDALREHLVNHTAWRYFHHSRHFNSDPMRSKDCLKNSLFDWPCNGDSLFRMDLSDSRFPCLARWQCGEHEIPVLLLGQVDSNYLCQSLVDVEFPANELPAVIPQRDKLINVDDGSFCTWEADNPLFIPISLIDFPEPWYRGVRISDQQMIRSALAARQWDAMPPDVDAPLNKGSTFVEGAIIITILILALIAASVFFG